MTPLEISPPEIRTGVSISVKVNTSLAPGNAFLTVVPRSHHKIESFSVPVSRLNSENALAQFTMMIPGSYEVVFGKQRGFFEVKEQRNLSFGVEFGLSAALIIFFLLGVLKWGMKQQEGQN